MKLEIRRDTDDTQDDGSLLAINVRFNVDGEVRRRLGMELVTANGATSLTRYTNTTTGRYAILVTDAGVMEAVAV